MEIAGSDICIDFGPQPLADSDRAELVMPVAWYHHLARGDQRADDFGFEPFVLGDLGDLRGDNSLACGFKLRHLIPLENHKAGAGPNGTAAATSIISRIYFPGVLRLPKRL